MAEEKASPGCCLIHRHGDAPFQTPNDNSWEKSALSVLPSMSQGLSWWPPQAEASKARIFPLVEGPMCSQVEEGRPRQVPSW